MKKAFYLIVLCIAISSCKEKGPDCPNGSQLPPIPPVTAATFRVMDQSNRDLLNISGSDRLNFDSLVATQPCNVLTPLKKELIPFSGSGSGGYYFKFNSRHPMNDENEECYYVYLQWNVNDMDTIQFITRTEYYDKCNTGYYLDKVIFNKKEAELIDGHYILKK